MANACTVYSHIGEPLGNELSLLLVEVSPYTDHNVRLEAGREARVAQDHGNFRELLPIVFIRGLRKSLSVGNSLRIASPLNDL